MTKIPTTGVSLKVKIFVILLTVVTAVAFSVFFFKLVNKISSSAKSSTPAKVISPTTKIYWAHELRLVGDKLKAVGLQKQAIDQYSIFLQFANVDSKTRALVSQEVAELYIELGDCHEALVWLYRAQAAGPSQEQMQSLESQINTCLKAIKSE